MPENGSGVVVCSSSLLLCGHPGRRQAETPLIQPVQKSRASSHSSRPGEVDQGVPSARGRLSGMADSYVTPSGPDRCENKTRTRKSDAAFLGTLGSGLSWRTVK